MLKYIDKYEKKKHVKISVLVMLNVYCYFTINGPCYTVVKITSNHVISQRIGSVSFQLTNASFHLKNKANVSLRN